MAIVKDIFIGTLIGGLAYVLFQKKMDNWKSTVSKLKAFPTGFRNLKIENSIIKFNLDISLHNPTNDDFKPDGIIAVLQKINIKDNVGNKIAQINVNRSYITIPAKSNYVLKDLKVEIPIMANLLNWQNLIKIKTTNDIKTEAIITVLGKEYLITN
jgi:hypothetical protein